MRIEIDTKSGFCFGVVRAIDKVEELLSSSQETVYCLGDIVHNRVEVSRLQHLGMQTISSNEIPTLSGKTMLIRAHGEPPSTYLTAQNAQVDVVDATCPVVAHLQKTVKSAYKAMQETGGQVVILGDRKSVV